MFVHTYAYGPYGLGKDEPPLYELPMMQYAFYKPLYGEYVPNGEVCAGATPARTPHLEVITTTISRPPP